MSYRPTTIQGTSLPKLELDILELMSEGSSDPEIADILGLGYETVKQHIGRIYARLGARNRTHAVALGYQQQLIRDAPGAEPRPALRSVPPTQAATSLTGAPLTDAVLPFAAQLIGAVRQGDLLDDLFWQAHRTAARVDGDAAQDRAGTISARALAIVLAAMVPDDREPSDLLAWMRHPVEYLRLREAGFDAATSAAEASAYAVSHLKAVGGGV
jgi:DNA-binding CsgD family transcriptional regulator